MNKDKIKIDNLSFGLFLSKIDHNTLVEYSRDFMPKLAMVNTILNSEYMHNDCMTMLFNKDLSLPGMLCFSMLSGELNLMDKEELLKLISLLFSKKNLINMFIDFANKETRLKIIEMYNNRNKPNTTKLFYN
jgi:hypothetical protein